MKKTKVKEEFLEHLKQIPIIQICCDKCNISRQTVYRWRKEDYEFKVKMDRASKEGDKFLNDLVESKFMGLINDRKWSAIKYHLDKKHPKYKLGSKDGHEGKMSLLELSEELDKEETRKKFGKKNNNWEEDYNDDE